MLRVEGADSDLARQSSSPGLADLDSLVTMARDAGLEVSLQICGDPSPEAGTSAMTLPGGVDMAAYRIVQESITNAIKYAGDARVAIILRHLPGAVGIRIEDDGDNASSSDRADKTVDEPGHGIRGMRARAEMLGGWLQAGPVPDGGFLVAAHLPTRVAV